MSNQENIVLEGCMTIMIFLENVQKHKSINTISIVFKTFFKMASGI